MESHLSSLQDIVRLTIRQELEWSERRFKRITMSEDADGNPAELYGAGGKIYYRKDGGSGEEIGVSVAGGYLPLSAGSGYPLTGDLYSALGSDFSLYGSASDDLTFVEFLAWEHADNRLSTQTETFTLGRGNTSVALSTGFYFYRGTTEDKEASMGWNETADRFEFMEEVSPTPTLAQILCRDLKLVSEPTNNHIGTIVVDDSSGDMELDAPGDIRIPTDNLDMNNNAINALGGITMHDATSPIAMTGSKITGLGTPVDGGDAANKQWVDAQLAAYLPLAAGSGSPLTGDLYSALGSDFSLYGSASDDLTFVEFLAWEHADNRLSTQTETFTLGRGNTSVALSTGFYFYRGTTEDKEASMGWNETADRFEFMEEVSPTPTLAQILCRDLKLVSEPTNNHIGTIVVDDSSGDMELDAPGDIRIPTDNLDMNNNAINALGGITMHDATSPIAMTGSKITGLGTPVDGGDAANKQWVDAQLAAYLPLAAGSGSPLTGDLYSALGSDFSLYGSASDDLTFVEFLAWEHADNRLSTQTETFTLGRGNTSVALSTGFYFYRGTTEDKEASMGWNETADRFEFMEEVSPTPTLAQILCRDLKLVSEPTNNHIGTIVVDDSSGDMELDAPGDIRIPTDNLDMNNNAINALGGITMHDATSPIAMTGSKITGLGTPVDGGDAANKQWVDAQLAAYLPLAAGSGSPLTGDLYSALGSDFSLYGSASDDLTFVEFLAWEHADNRLSTQTETFTLGRGNTSVALSTGFYFYRGTTEDKEASMGWNETADRFEFMEEVSPTPTLAQILCRDLKLVSEPTNNHIGTIVVDDSSGDMELDAPGDIRIPTDNLDMNDNAINALGGITMHDATSPIAMTGSKITGLGTPVDGGDAANKQWVDAQLAAYLPLAAGSGSPLTGDLYSALGSDFSLYGSASDDLTFVEFMKWDHANERVLVKKETVFDNLFSGYEGYIALGGHVTNYGAIGYDEGLSSMYLFTAGGTQILRLSTGLSTFSSPVQFSGLISGFTVNLVKFNPLSSVSATEGAMYYDSDDNKLKVYNGVAWETISSSV